MGICYIVGAGEDCGLDFTPTAEDLVIAADGGYEKLRQASIRPDLVIGDFDSLGAAPEGEKVITLPVVKDVTDTWAAIELGKERGYGEFWLYGCTGGRFEHTMANVQTLAALAAAAALGGERVIFSPMDRNRVGKKVVVAANNLLEAQGKAAGLTLAEQTRDIPGGLILERGRVEINCAFDSMIAAQRSRLTGEVAKVLFD